MVTFTIFSWDWKPETEMKKNISIEFSLPFLSLACRSLGLLMLEAASTGLCVWFILHHAILPRYIAQNIIRPHGREILLLSMFAPSILVGLSGILYLGIRRYSGAVRLSGVANRLAPLAVAAFIPLLFDWRPWGGQELTFLSMTLLAGLAGQKLIQVSAASPALFPGFNFGSRLNFMSQGIFRRLPLIMIVASVIAYAIYFSYVTIIHHHNILSTSFDLGLEDNILWNLVHGAPIFKNSPMSGPNGSQLGYHATFFAYVIAPVYALVQRPETLLVIQSLFIGATAIPLFLFAARHVRTVFALILALGYLLYPPLHGSNLYDFHYVIFGPFFLCLTLCLLETRRDRWAILSILLTLSIREDVAPGLCIMGGYLLLTGRRPKAGLVVTLVGLLYFIGIKFLVMPHFAGHEAFTYMYQGLLPSGEKGFLGILKTVFGNPAYLITNLMDFTKLVYILQLMVPLLFLPLRRPIGLLFMIPGFFFTLLSTGYLPLTQISFQYTAHWTVYLFIATVLNLAWLGQSSSASDHGGPLRQKAWLIALVFSMLACSHQYGAVIQRNTAWGGFGPYHFKTTPEDQKRYQALYELIPLVPPRAKIAGSETVVPHISGRPDAYTLRIGIFDAEWILFMMTPAWPAEQNPVKDVLKRGEFGVVKISKPFALLKRGYEISGNADLLERMERP